MDFDGWTKLLVALGTVIGGLRWLIRVYIVQQKKIEIARQETFNAQIKTLSQECSTLKEQIQNHTQKISEFEERVAITVQAFQQNQKAAEKVYKALTDFINEVNGRLDKLEIRTERIGKIILKR